MADKTTDTYNPMVTIHDFPDDGKLQIIHGYGEGQFRIAGAQYFGAQFILPRQTLSWSVKTLSDITAENIVKMVENTPIELVILGVGARADSHLPKIARALQAHQIRLEVMTTPAACRTWNVLLTEGRSAAAGLLPVD